jgi:hypothetical protein
VVIGVHAPEFAFEKDEANVRRAVHDLGVTYPVALDNNLKIWRLSTTNTGRRIISSTRKGASAITISARANMTNRRK